MPFKYFYDDRILTAFRLVIAVELRAESAGLTSNNGVGFGVELGSLCRTSAPQHVLFQLFASTFECFGYPIVRSSRTRLSEVAKRGLATIF